MPTTQTKPHPSWRITRRLHGIMDYVFGFLLLASPLIIPMGEQRLGAEIATTLGLATLVISLVTNYEMGAIPLLPFRGHLFFDVLVGIALIGCPWHFSLGGTAAVVLCTFGAIELGLVVLTERPKEHGTTA